VERVSGRRRRDILEHVVVLNAQHRRRLLTDDLTYDHQLRTYLSLGMDGLEPRPLAPPEAGTVIVVPAVEGPHNTPEDTRRPYVDFPRRFWLVSWRRL
jgi:hypothetical protein